MPTSSSNASQPRSTLSFWGRWGGWVIGGLVALLALAVLWYLLAGTASTRRAAPETAMLMLPPPPPPPPEPEKLPEPEPEKVEPKITEVEPTPVEPQKDDKPLEDAPPSPSPDAGDPVTMNAEAQAGVGGVLVGGGGGSTGGGGGGLGGRFYERYVSTLLQQALARDPRTRNLVFADLRVDIWLAADGRTTRVQLAQGTGDERIDEAVIALVRGIEQFDERPPQTMRFPMRVSMRGSRPS
ncbi:energy transducer TonB [Xenophilus arseniciresistens]|uniref:Energy transducer TonB n=1 Tax=Xenophilus arseniciresistens TaxID=1283306 RepID=A0AAE3SYN6_9BURK|nr:energy transducer TonB [Xenophilus arseniciresistens]MDA7414996.1 energy transducer TonB [Xenophilus arseniciresistens]